MEAENSKHDQDQIFELLKQKLPKSTAATELEGVSQWGFALKTRPPKKSPANTKKKKLFLTRNERKELNILKLPKTKWKYNELDGMRELWRGYMRKNLSLYRKTPKIEEANWNNFNVSLAKSEFIGAELKVVRSKVVNQVGMGGTVVLETKSTFQIVTPKNELKTLIKKPSVFSFTLDEVRFTIFGKHMETRPGERSVKKIKSNFIPDL